jgi:hypothetical protein
MNVMASAMGGLKEKLNRRLFFLGDENGSLLCKGVGPVHGTEKENFPSCAGCVHCHVLMAASDINSQHERRPIEESAFFLRSSH